jgi:hypothetical protein
MLRYHKETLTMQTANLAAFGAANAPIRALRIRLVGQAILAFMAGFAIVFAALA